MDKLQPFVAQFKMNYPVLQGLGHDDVQDAYGPMFGIPVSVADFARWQDLREAQLGLLGRRKTDVRERDQGAALVVRELAVI